ncbi:VOC family protein [Ramlibacter sp.]|uniref:VOC family protein n=1 Tax=Ramlibacter sp. TaxID=1917967 RepID=UPI003D12E239
MLKSAAFYASVPVRDIARARKFYEETLELGPGQEVGPGVSLTCGKGTTCLMYPSATAGEQRGSCAFWQVDDIEAVVGWLRTRDVQFEEYDTPEMKTVNGVFSAAGSRTAWFRDSEGNLMTVIQGLAH